MKHSKLEFWLHWVEDKLSKLVSNFFHATDLNKSKTVDCSWTRERERERNKEENERKERERYLGVYSSEPYNFIVGSDARFFLDLILFTTRNCSSSSSASLLLLTFWLQIWLFSSLLLAVLFMVVVQEIFTMALSIYLGSSLNV